MRAETWTPEAAEDMRWAFWCDLFAELKSLRESAKKPVPESVVRQAKIADERIELIQQMRLKRQREREVSRPEPGAGKRQDRATTTAAERLGRLKVIG